MSKDTKDVEAAEKAFAGLIGPHMKEKEAHKYLLKGVLRGQEWVKGTLEAEPRRLNVKVAEILANVMKKLENYEIENVKKMFQGKESSPASEEGILFAFGISIGEFLAALRHGIALNEKRPYGLPDPQDFAGFQQRITEARKISALIKSLGKEKVNCQYLQKSISSMVKDVKGPIAQGNENRKDLLTQIAAMFG